MLSYSSARKKKARNVNEAFPGSGNKRKYCLYSGQDARQRNELFNNDAEINQLFLCIFLVCTPTLWNTLL